MSYYWTTKMNDATNRRLDKMIENGLTIDTETHEGRKLIGYNYLELAFEESEE